MFFITKNIQSEDRLDPANTLSIQHLYIQAELQTNISKTQGSIGLKLKTYQLMGLIQDLDIETSP